MLADIIIVAIVGVLFVLCIRKQVIDHKNGVPSCGLNCGHCTSGSCGGESCSCQTNEVPERFKAKKK